MRWTVPAQDEPVRLVDHAHAHLAVVRRRAVGPLIAAGHVLVDGTPGRIAQPLHGGEVLTVAGPAIARLVEQHAAAVPSARPLTVVHEDAVHLVVDKPAGLHVAPTGGHGEDAVTTRLLHHAGARPDQPWASWRPYPVHRLDRATSGLLLIAKDAATAELLQGQLRAGAVHRTYTATVEGHVTGDAGVVDAALGRDPADGYRRTVVPDDAADAQPARTRWQVVSRSGDPARTTLRVTLETGRTHQVRVHLASLGHPVVGDTLYGAAPTATRGITSEIAPGSPATHPTHTPAAHPTGDADPDVTPTATAHLGPAIALRASAIGYPDPTTGRPVVLAAPAG